MSDRGEREDLELGERDDRGRGYVLPVFAAAAAVAAVRHLLGRVAPEPAASAAAASVTVDSVTVDLLDGTTAAIAIEQVAALDNGTALAIARSDPGDNLDLTRHTPVWAWVQWRDRAATDDGDRAAIAIEGGEGVGHDGAGRPAIYRFARQLIERNVLPLLPADRAIVARIILPEGRLLAKRTSNEAFGIVEGLSLLGTQGTVEAHTAVERLESFKAYLHAAIARYPAGEADLIFCIGSNGRQVAARLGLPDEAIVTAGNWLGALLVAATVAGARSILLVGYHGKLIKLAGGIFNTSSHVADGKLEILTAAALRHCDDAPLLRQVAAAPTIAEAQTLLAARDLQDRVFDELAARIAERAAAYGRKYGDRAIAVGALMFDRAGETVAIDPTGRQLLARWGVTGDRDENRRP